MTLLLQAEGMAVLTDLVSRQEAPLRRLAPRWGC
jgi:hypothetical protein